MKIMTQGDLAEAVKDYDPDKDGRLGDYLVKESVISDNDLQRALAIQKGQEPVLQPV